jgi:hypothetical protein
MGDAETKRMILLLDILYRARADVKIFLKTELAGIATPVSQLTESPSFCSLALHFEGILLATTED